ncbi:hypothetical protein KQX54_006344 [Cotesia glomerata]|uniref:Uncharacterized protein n=1 Tax=Cotesia glomerata TaxID=32391 RepID=A0AAV7IQK8_COTGL|nr:hypothetical protein KQX54_006344 [Cotesia glomerata]
MSSCGRFERDKLGQSFTCFEDDNDWYLMRWLFVPAAQSDDDEAPDEVSVNVGGQEDFMTEFFAEMEFNLQIDIVVTGLLFSLNGRFKVEIDLITIKFS